MTLKERLNAPGPKRILTLDGGGIRGMISLSFLREVEAVLRARSGREDFRLCDYFDLICGTSTGAIIAAGLACGFSVKELSEAYHRLGSDIFGKKRAKFWKAVFSEKPLDSILYDYIGDTTLGGPEVKTGLCVVTKRADTNSVWPLINHPDGKFYDSNKGIILRNAVLASTAAPVFFQPAQIEVSPGETATFVDGGVSMANNPALQAFLVATLKGFPFGWKTGEDKLLLVSIGTGFYDLKVNALKMAKQNVWGWLKHVPTMLMQDALKQNELIMQYLSRSLTSWHIDSEIGDLADDLLCVEPALTYVRYNVRLEEDYLKELGVEHLLPELKQLRQLSSTGQILNLEELGDRGAEKQLSEEHFPAVFDLEQK